MDRPDRENEPGHADSDSPSRQIVAKNMAAKQKTSSKDSSATIGFEAKMPRLVAELNGQFAESAKLEQTIKRNLEGLGYAP